MNLTQFAEWLIEAYHSDDGMPEAKEICREARAALAAQPVAGAVATDETGWLIEHSGEILPGAEQRAQVSWLRVQMKFNGYGAREFGFTHDANEALRFARKEDAEAVLAMHLGASPPDWYSKPFSVTEHMWPLVPQPQAAPAPEPSAQAVAHPSHQTVREWMPVSEALRLSDLWTAGDLDNCGQWRAAIKVLADEVRALAASPQPEPSAQGEPVRQADERGDMAMREWHRECDDADTILRALGLDPVNCRTDGGSLKTGMILDALQARDRILQRAAPSTQPHAVAWISPKDRVPKGGEVVLCLFRDKGIHTALFRGTSTTHGVFEAWHGFLVADLPTDRVIGWVPLASAPSTPPHAVVEAGALTDEQIERIRLELCDNFILGRLSAQVLARAIERAHGIAPKAAQEKT